MKTPLGRGIERNKDYRTVWRWYENKIVFKEKKLKNSMLCLLNIESEITFMMKGRANENPGKGRE